MRFLKCHFPHPWFPWIGLVLSLSTSLLTWHFVRKAETKRIQEHFLSECTLVEEKITQKMLALEQILKGASQFVAHGSGLPTRPEFKHYVQNLDLSRLNPGVQGLGFSQWIPFKDLNAHIQRMRAEGFPEYQVKPGGPLTPEGGVSSIIYLEPMDERNLRAFSMDMHGERLRRLAMNRARDYGFISLTGKVKLYQEGNAAVQAGTLLYAPVYAKNARLDTVQQRRDALLGWTYMPFRMENLILAALGSHPKSLSVQLYDGDQAQGEQLLYRTQPAGVDAFQLTRHVEVSGQTWTLCCAPGPEFYTSLGGGSHFVTLFLGLFTSIGICVILFHVVRAEDKALKLAREQLENVQKQQSMITSLLDAIPDIIFFKNLEGLYMGCNPPFCQLVGRTPKEIIQNTDYDLFARDMANAFRDNDRIVLANLTPRHNEEWVQYPDGRSVLLDTLKTPYYNPKGELLGILGIARDITDQKAAEDQLLMERKRLADILEGTNTGTWEWNIQTGETRFNARWAEIIGYTLEELEPTTLQTWMDLAHPDDVKHSSQLLERHFKGESPYYECEARMRHKNGNWVWVLDRGRVSTWQEDGRPLLMSGTHQDITDRKAAEEARIESEQRLAHALAATGDGVWDWSIETGSVKHNARWCEILGLGQEYLEHPIEFFASRIHEDDRDGVMAKVQACLQGGKAYFSRHRMRQMDESVIWVVDRGQVVEKRENGTPLRMIGSIADVTDLVASETAQKATELELRFQSRLQQMLMEISSTYINLPLEGLDDTIEASLGELARFVGADRSYIFKYDWFKATCSNTHEWCGEDVTPERDNLQNVSNEGIPEWINAHQRGEVMHIPDVLALPKSPLRDILEPQGILSLLTVPLMDGYECTGFVGFDAVKKPHAFSLNEQKLLTFFAQMLVNVWRRKRSEAALREANFSLGTLAEKAKAASKAKSEFLANMSHEIRTPMNGILGMLDLLLETQLSEKQHHYAQSAYQSGESLLGLINDILDLSKVEAGKMQLEESPFDLQSLLQEVHLTLNASASKKHLDFHVEVQPHTPTHLKGDPARLRQVLINLAGNAIKFTPQGHVDIRVQPVEVDSDHALLTFSVSDSGIGIRPDKQEDIFYEFTQADASTTRKYGGTGLGLAISRRLVELMGGTLRLTSREGEGSTFFFTLRLQMAVGEMAQLQDLQKRRNPLRRDFRGAPILLVEDNLVNQDVAVAILEQWGLQVDIANNGREAIEALKRKVYQLVLMDVQMPEMDGIEATTILRQAASGVLNPAIPVVAMTAHAMAEDRQKCLDAGMNDFLTKPVNPGNLMAALERNLLCVNPSTPPPGAPEPTTTALPGKPEPPVFDRANLYSRLMNNATAVSRVIEAFREDITERLQSVEQALAAGDLDTLKREFHTLKGSSATLGGERLREKAAQMEKLAKADDLDGLKATIPSLKKEIQLLLCALEDSEQA